MAANRSLISGFIICYNEEQQIADCLKSLEFCDELIVIDSGSTDRTLEIAKSYNAKVFYRGWTGFRDQKAFGLEHCSHGWVINLDADERVSEELKNEILSILERSGKGENLSDGYDINRVVYFQGRWWRKGGWYPEFRLRFFKKATIEWGGIDPHEKPICSGSIARLNGEILHFTYSDFFDQASRLLKYSHIMAREEYKQGKRSNFSKVLFNPIGRFFKFYFIKKGILEGRLGFTVAILETYYTFLKYLFLWERSLAHNDKNLSNKTSR